MLVYSLALSGTLFPQQLHHRFRAGLGRIGADGNEVKNSSDLPLLSFLREKVYMQKGVFVIEKILYCVVSIVYFNERSTLCQTISSFARGKI